MVLPCQSRAAVLTIADITPNPAFDDSDPIFTGKEVIVGQSAGLFDNVIASSPRPTGASILFRYVHLHRRNDCWRSNATTGDGFRPFTETVSGINGTPLDGMIGDGFATITVSAIPEPSSAALIAVDLHA